MTDADYLRTIFDTVPVSIWVEDFSKVKAAMDELRSQGVTDFRGYFAEHPEFVKKAMRMVKVVDVNAASLKLFEAKDKQELLGSLGKVLSQDAMQGFLDELVAVAEGKTMFEGEIPDRTLRGKSLHLWRTIIFPDGDSNFSNILVSLTDITEHKRVERELRVSSRACSRCSRHSPSRSHSIP